MPMGVNKVEYGDEVLVDLTVDTVTPETLAKGTTATNAQGEKIVGILPIAELIGGNNIRLEYNEENHTITIKLADNVTLKGNYPLALTKGTDEYKGYCYINPPKLPSGTVDLHIPSKSGTIALLSDLEGLGGSSKAIIDVTELPTENINEEAFYRMLTAKWVSEGYIYNAFTCYCVETLPDTAIPATTDMQTITTYYCVADGVVYGYVDDMLAGYFGIPSGWYPVDMLFQTVGWYYGGVITDIKDSEWDVAFKVLLGYTLYTYKDGKWEAIKSVGSAGTGIDAVFFNASYNEATGDYSFAMGNGTKAKGKNSVAEGDCTWASGRDQHAQGRYNIEDTEDKYAHIVGNGEDGNPSNAHTIDWQGNGWFAGTIKVGGTRQDDEEAKELATKDDLSNLATVDKIDYIDTWYDAKDGMSRLTVDLNGVSWHNRCAIDDSNGDNFKDTITISERVPIVAGENVTFEVDEENNVVKINATGGGSADNVALMVTVSTDYPTTMSAIVTAIQEAGGDISKLTFVTLTGYLTCNLAMSFAWRGGNYYRVECIDLDTLTRIYNATTDNSVYDATSMRISEFLDAGRPEEKEEMPQIRFVGMPCGGYFGYVEPEAHGQWIGGYTNLKFTVEIVGGGALQIGDAIQICRMGCYGSYSRKKRKLRRLFEYAITEDDLDKRFITFEVPCDDKKAIKLFTQPAAIKVNDKSIYFRIRRPKGEINSGDNGGGMTVDAEFSNVVPIRCYSYQYVWCPDDEDEIHYYHIRIT